MVATANEPPDPYEKTVAIEDRLASGIMVRYAFAISVKDRNLHLLLTRFVSVKDAAISFAVETGAKKPISGSAEDLANLANKHATEEDW